MKKLYNLLLPLLILLAVNIQAQERYIDEIFTDDDIVVEPDVTYGVNATILFYSVVGQAVPQELKMDIHWPDTNVDDVEERPLVIYFHTGNFLPQPTFCNISGRKDDNTSLGIIEKLVKRGFVVASCDYRLGWNPLALSQEERTNQLINAAYRGVQDARTAIRFHRKLAVDEGNPYKIDPDKITIWGNGTGGYITFATNTIDAYAELVLPKFTASTGLPMVLEPVNGNILGTSYGIIPPGTPGFPPAGDTLCYPNHVAYADGSDISSDAQLAVNMGGALGDTSWISPDDAPMISFQVPDDPFAPYETAILIVPTTDELVVEVSGAYDVQTIANAQGINDVFLEYDGDDPFTAAANANNDGLEGLYPFLRPVWPNPLDPDSPIYESAPWDWWIQDEWDDVFCDFAPGIDLNTQGIFEHPDMSMEKGLMYADSAMGYFAPRACAALNLGCSVVSVEEVIDAQDVNLSIAPNPADQEVVFRSDATTPIETIEIFNFAGQMVESVVVDNNQYTFNRGDLPNGMYVAKLRFEKGVVSSKLVLR